MIERPFLFEATRMIATRWTGRSPTGIDRVCQAYLRHFGSRSQAVVQHRGLVRIFSPRHSDELFAMLGDAAGGARRRMASLAPRAWAGGAARADGAGATYLNVSHTDFDLTGHRIWLRACRLRPVYLIHDLIPITHARYCTPWATLRHTGRVTGALRTAAGIIVNSQSTARELEAYARRERLPVPPLTVAPLAGADLRRLEPARGDTPPYFLCVGTIEERKNHRLLLEVWQRLIAELGTDTPRLVIVGQWGAKSAAVRQMLEHDHTLRRHVDLITWCSDHDLAQWIAGARALLMPTMAEGFGLPVVEALALGKPVIASDLPCFRETGQGIPCLLDPLDSAAWARVIARFSGADGEQRRQLRLLGQFRPTVWEDHFAQVEGWLAELPTWPDQARGPAIEASGRRATGASGPVAVARRLATGGRRFEPARQTAEARS